MLGTALPFDLENTVNIREIKNFFIFNFDS